MIKELTIADVEQQMAANRAKQGKELAALEADKTLSVEGRAGQDGRRQKRSARCP